MNQLNLIDKDLQKTAYQNCSISILLASDGYCFSIKDNVQDRYMALRCVPGAYVCRDVFDAGQALSEEIWGKPVQLKTDYLLYAEQKSIIVPQAFADNSGLKEIMDFHFPVQIGKRVLKEQFRSYAIAYLVDDNAHTNYLDYFKPRCVHNMAYPLINTALQYSEGQNKNAVHVQVWNGYIDLLVVKDAQLALYNTYRCKTGNDMVYFILNAYKQLMLNPNDCALMLSGWIEKNDNAVIQLNKFIRHMYFETLNTEKKYSYHFQDSLPHYFIHFLNLD